MLIPAAAALASLLTFFTGFGLATVLTPVMLVFFPPPMAIALTAVVHFLNNVFKYLLMRKHIDWRTLLRFGAPAAVGALIGAFLLRLMPPTLELYRYEIGAKAFQVTLLKLVIGALMIAFALFEAVPRLKNLEFGADKIYFGGFLSGFFGGLSGHQGALRSVFLVRSGLEKETFVATGIAIACVVDIGRLIVYRPFSAAANFNAHGSTILIATLAAFAGALVGNLLLKKVTLKAVQVLVAIAVSAIGLFMAAGII